MSRSGRGRDGISFRVHCRSLLVDRAPVRAEVDDREQERENDQDVAVSGANTEVEVDECFEPKIL